MRTILRGVLLSALYIAPAAGMPVAIGFLSFDVFIPGSTDTPGINTVTVANLTGGFALPPTFPVLNVVTFLNSAVTIDSSGSQSIVNLGDFAPGFSDSGTLLFPEPVPFSSITFTATIDPLVFLTPDGVLTLTSSAIVVTLTPTIGGTLVAGTDFVLITADGEPAPEPTTWIMIALGIAVAGGVTRLQTTTSTPTGL